MSLKAQLLLKSIVLKGHVNRYALLGLGIALGSIFIATCLASYQATGQVSIEGIVHAQLNNPAIWALDLTPFMFAYWGQSFCYHLASKAETIIEDKTREYVHEKDDLQSKLRYESLHDSLTNLPNNHLLSQRVNQGIQQLNEGESLVLIVVIIDRFREINFDIGNFRANSLLVQFAEKIKSFLLEPYMLQAHMGMNMAARLQSAEFAILLPRFRKENQLEMIMDKLSQETSTGFMIDGYRVDIKTHSGVAVYPTSGQNDIELIDHATLASLSAEKEKQPYKVYDPSMEREFNAKRMMLKELEKAIEAEQLSMLYQPVVDIKSDKIIGCEASIELESEEYGRYGSDKLISLVEGTKLLEELNRFNFKHVIMQIAKWHQAGFKIFGRLPLYDVSDPTLVTEIKTLLDKNKLDAKYLRIELTEQACLRDQSHTSKMLNKFAQLGIKIAISDFASGYSSFVYLTNFPINEIKIDKSYVAEMLKDKKKYRIVLAMVKLAEAMKLSVFADGVNSVDIKDELLKLGCKIGQGDFFEKPVHQEQLINQLKK